MTLRRCNKMHTQSISFAHFARVARLALRMHARGPVPSLVLKALRNVSSRPATSRSATERGVVAKRRFQKGQFEIKDNGAMYSLYYVDAKKPDGTWTTKRVRHFIGNLESMSERAGRREHERIMHNVNQKRGSVAPSVRGKSFKDCVAAWRSAIAPHLSPSTVRQRESYLRAHILPRFKDSTPQSLDLPTLQQFATDLRKTLSRKTTINILSAIFAILDYARKCGVAAPKVTFSDLELGEPTSPPDALPFTPEESARIIAAAEEPYKTMFMTDRMTGLRAGELLSLTVSDLDFNKRTIRVCRSSDDATRQIRQTKTPRSTATLPMPTALEKVLRNYLKNHWTPNPAGLLFPNRKGTRPRLRDNVVRFGLRPILKKLGIPMTGGLHRFRHGLATELADKSVPLPVLQSQMRHADVKTTLRVYSHVIQQSHRDAMESLGQASIGTNVPFGTQKEA